MQSGSIGSHQPVQYTAGIQPKPITRENVEAARSRQTASAPAAPSTPGVMERDGVTYRVEGGDIASRETRSGVSVKHGAESHTFSLPGGTTIEVGVEQGGRGVRYDLSRMAVAEGEVSGLEGTKNEDGLELISFRDREGNTVALEPSSLTFEVRNKHDNLSQVYHPDGHQEVVVFGTVRGEDGRVKPFENRALYGPEGDLEGTRGFQDYRLDGDKVRFKMPNGQSATRSLVRSLPGQPASEATGSAPPTGETPATSTAVSEKPAHQGPIALDVTGPLLLDGGLPPLPDSSAAAEAPVGPSFLELANQQLHAEGRGPIAEASSGGPVQAKAETAPQAEASSGGPVPAKAEPAPQAEAASGAPVPVETKADPAPPPGPFDHLTDISSDFLAGGDRDDVELQQLENGVLVRDEGESRAFKLPNGHAFRTDGENVEVVGDPAQARQVRTAVEDERQYVAYSDRAGNRYKIDVESGDYEVSNRQGSLTQKFGADGSKDFQARGTYTTEAGTPQQYHHKASFEADGSLKSLEGFAGLKIEGDKLVFTLPNGVETGRNLVEPTDLKYETPREKPPVSRGIADGWGKSLEIGEQRFASGPSQASTPGSTSLPPTPSGLTREPLPGGGAATTLPNGIVLHDLPPQPDGTERSYATDALGARMAVDRTPYTTEGGEPGHLLSFSTGDGTSYILSDQHLDMIVGSADGKVQQMVRAGGQILSAVTDGPNRFLHETNTVEGWQLGSPGVGVDPHAPSFLQVQGAPQGGYALPWPTTPPTAALAQGEADPFSSREGAFEPGYPGAGQASAHARPGQPQQGFQPSFWQRLKGAFTGENPWSDPARAGAQDAASGPSYGGPYGAPPQFGGFPGANYGGFVADPYLEEMQRTNRAMMTMNVATMALSALPMMFYGSYMMF